MTPGEKSEFLVQETLRILESSDLVIGNVIALPAGYSVGGDIIWDNYKVKSVSPLDIQRIGAH